MVLGEIEAAELVFVLDVAVAAFRAYPKALGVGGRKEVAVAADVAAFPGGDAHHKGVVGNGVGDDGAGGDKGVAANAKAGQEGGVGA